MLKAKKSYGQNFLINEGVIDKILTQFDEARTSDNVLEVGPGKGALTKNLIHDTSINFKAIDADREMIDYLKQHYEMTDETLLFGDFLKLPLETVFDQQEYNVLGNFPYNISSQIVFRIHKYIDIVPFMMGMFQKELAERIVAGPGSKTYGIISVIVQSVFEVKMHFHVSPGSFSPAPKVTSAIISLKRKENFNIPCNPKLFRNVVKVAFNQRRKMLRNTLKPLIKDPDLLKEDLFTMRPEQLGLEQYYYLTNLIENSQS